MRLHQDYQVVNDEWDCTRCSKRIQISSDKITCLKNKDDKQQTAILGSTIVNKEKGSRFEWRVRARPTAEGGQSIGLIRLPTSILDLEQSNMDKSFAYILGKPYTSINGYDSKQPALEGPVKESEQLTIRLDYVNEEISIQREKGPVVTLVKGHSIVYSSFSLIGILFSENQGFDIVQEEPGRNGKAEVPKALAMLGLE
mmetsp:Transcript_35857/g.54995  ORF Transcript_35857/g.54995 Transcript_35857/m.54995 type:complete len:199 (+) Transcript_35857:2-598(+)